MICTLVRILEIGVDRVGDCSRVGRTSRKHWKVEMIVGMV